MNQAVQPVNAWETWSLYDTVCVGIGQSGYHSKWYETFAAMGQDTNIPFFNQRNRSSVGVPYCSFDSAEQISFGFQCFSFGLEWYTPVLGESLDEVASANNNPQLFFELLRHCSVRLQVSQDEKILLNGLMTPGGGGFTGIARSDNVTVPVTTATSWQTLANGSAKLKNRYKFVDPRTMKPEPINIPRNRNIAAWVEFSPYAKELLKLMEGPNEITIDATGVVSVNACYMLRLSMFGKREVQQRNALHF